MNETKEGVRKLTKEISAVIERNLRVEILRERKTLLEEELARVRGELRGLGRPRPVRRPAKRRAKRRVAKARRVRSRGGKLSAHALIIDILRRARRPMKVREVTNAALRRGWKCKRKDPSKTIDAALRKNPEDFRKAAPGTFALIRS